ncbi:calpain-9-like [Glandiceps talaboti]
MAQKQDYATIKRACLARGELWEDPEFLTVNSSMFFSRSPPRPFVWKRPGEIVSDPQMFVGGASRFDVAQGMLGDCWFLAAIASLSLHENLLHRVVPPDQSFSKDYAGIFRFQFWRYGEWRTVCVDDRLPTYNNKLVFLHSRSNNEFWTALLEKAYAKMNGSYEGLKGGSTVEAMEDFTGGVGEVYEMRGKEPKNLVKIMLTGMERQSLLGCSINPKPNEVESKLDNGLIMGHAYSITGVRRVSINTSSGVAYITLVRIRNPWGQKEWNGAWSDGSREWRYISDEEKQKLELTVDDDGEFWMSYRDFAKEFQRLEIVNLTPDELSDGIKGKKWNATNENSRWLRGSTAGGCRNFINTFATNPQFRIELTEEDDDDPDDEDEGCSVIVALMQKDRRRQKALGKVMLTMGFSIYKVDDGSPNILPKDYFMYHASTARSATFVNAREVSGRFRLPKGNYAVIPSTFDPNEEGNFLLRLMSVKASSSAHADEQTGRIETPPEPEKPLTPAQQAQEDKLRQFFQKLSGNDMEIDCWELQQILNGVLKKELVASDGFSLESCKSMLALFDDDMSGKLGFNEFKVLWKDIAIWKNVFKKLDKDNSGTFSTFEMRDALRAVGYTVSEKTFGALVLRYGDKNQLIDFDSFIQCAVKLEGMFSEYILKTFSSLIPLLLIRHRK